MPNSENHPRTQIFDTEFSDLRGVPGEYGDVDSLLRADEAWNAAYHWRDPERLIDMLADDWIGFFPDGTIAFKTDLLEQLPRHPPATLMFERHASLVFGHTGITRGTLYADGVRLQSFLRVYTWQGGKWWAVIVQVVA
ncbi:nuclear transport factor 2 family protein [Deinococcus sp.]|uniref:nuclear transport factor 2 family protein n=1 Tax=Deinococcus sp. TaxID=47478 RepID=UPI0025C4FCC4|nr:nuclear transport factor 2 family protein [Deinococcus sp.]